MTKPVLSLVLLAIAGVLPAMPAQAQTRVFVAAQGADGNPCTFAAPCRTFQHAHDVVAAGGEIDVLDPAGYGSVTITKSISIQGHGFAGLSVASGTNGITVNAGATGVVNINGLLIDGVGVGHDGIVFNIGKSLIVENCVIRNLASAGIDFLPSVSSALAVSNTLLADNASFGIQVNPTGENITVTAAFNRIETHNNGGSGIALNGQSSTGSIKATVVDSVASNNGNTGFFVLSAAMQSSTSLMMVRSLAAHNGVGVYALQPNTTIRIAQSTVTDNADGWVAGSGGTLLSYGDNYIDGNAGSQGAPTGTPKS
jgi:hypothetical protein